MLNGDKITYFAETDNRNKKIKFGIKEADRQRHVYILGKSGTGKSTLLENMVIQDIQNGNGVAFIDPHGKSAELLLDYVPEERINDVLYFAPFDLDYPVSFNVMEDVGEDKRHLVANGLMSAFKKIWVDSWSARMEYILNNILLALLEYPESTLLGVNRMLADKDYRKKIVSNITDVSVKAFWEDEFAKYGERYMQEAGAAIQNKVGQFISNPLIRNIIGQPHSSFDFREIQDNKKIVIVNLSKGRVGEANANLLGGMLITKIYLASMSRADVSEEVMKTLPNFYLYVDEFQSFANESFADILSEARKYKLNLTIAHQYIEQMEDEVRAAVFGNIGTMIIFRLGATDATVLEKEFAPQFTPEDLVNLSFPQIYLKLLIDGVSSSPFSARTLPPFPKPTVSFKNQIIENSRKKFAKTRYEVEKYIINWHTDSQKINGKEKENGNNKNKYTVFDKKDDKNISNTINSKNFDRKPYIPTKNFKQEISTETTTKTIQNIVNPANTSAEGDFLNRNNSGSGGFQRNYNSGFQRNNFSKPFKTQNNEAEFRKAISLNYLKPVDETKKPVDRKKKISEENVTALREALSEILGENKKNGNEPSQIENEDNGVKTETNLTTQTEKILEETKPAPIEDKVKTKTEEQKQKEIPENVLLEILKVEEKNIQNKNLSATSEDKINDTGKKENETK